MFFHGHLIIGYVQDPECDRYLFQLAGGDECAVSREEFVSHWQQYCQYENERASQHIDHYRPLPITLETRKTLKIYPVNPDIRRKKQSA